MVFLTHKPIGVLGGTFDPIHYGHLYIAQTLHDYYALDKVRLIPTGKPPHRDAPRARGQDRWHMTCLATKNMPNFIADDREIRCESLCYTFNTLTQLQAENNPAPLVWALGTDAFMQFSQWHRWQALLDIAHLALFKRVGTSIEDWYQTLPTVLQREYTQRLVEQRTIPYRIFPGKISLLPDEVPFIISASLLRMHIAQKRSLQFLTPDSVIHYIYQQGLYKDDTR